MNAVPAKSVRLPTDPLLRAADAALRRAAAKAQARAMQVRQAEPTTKTKAPTPGARSK
jgi:hypothetical protein